MNKGDFILVEPSATDIVGRLIDYFTTSGFCHVALVCGPNEVIEATPDHGVIRRPIGYRRYGVWEILGITDEQRETAVNWALKQQGAKYDYFEIADEAIRHLLEMFHDPNNGPVHFDLWQSHGKFICSALVDSAYREAGIILRPDKDKGNVAPVDLMYTPQVHFLENHGLY